MLAGLFRGAVAELVDEALSSALAASPAGAPTGVAGDPGAAGPLRVAVIGDVALGRALAALHKRRPPGTPERPLAIELMIVAEPGARAAKKLEHVLVGTPAQLPVADGELAAVVGVGALAPDNAVALHPWITEWVRAVRDGGAVVLVDRAPRTLATRHALCAGLTEIEQRASGRAVVTSGLTTKQLPTRARR
jgi:hypothetical protein